MKAVSPLDRAERLARELAITPEITSTPDGVARARRVAIGDPQASLVSVLSALDRRGLLDGHGRLAPEVLLVSMGDHFDWGGRHRWREATEDATALACWLAAHPPDQVVMLAGNHDLGRVGELISLDQAGFEQARDEAARVYFGPPSVDGAELAFLERWPMFPSPEVAARDFSCFEVAQRELVRRLLAAGRLPLAFAAAPDLLLVHAGVTERELEATGVPPDDRRRAPVVADALNGALNQALCAWTDAPLSIPHLHEPGDAAQGEGGGALYHRPADPRRGAPEEFHGPRRRRYDPRHLPRGLTQAIGHVRDSKCRVLMPDWHDGAAARDGVVRALVTDGREVRYQHGLLHGGPERATLWLLDAGMQHLPDGAVPLLDLDQRSAV